jgi:hypothetical protein
MFSKEFMTKFEIAMEEYIMDSFIENKISIKITGELYDNDERYRDIIEDSRENLFNKNRDFANYFYNNYEFEPNMYSQMLLYCNKWLRIHFGETSIIKKNGGMFDGIYVIKMMTYIYIQCNREKFITLLNENKCLSK